MATKLILPLGSSQHEKLYKGRSIRKVETHCSRLNSLVLQQSQHSEIPDPTKLEAQRSIELSCRPVLRLCIHKLQKKVLWYIVLILEEFTMYSVREGKPQTTEDGIRGVCQVHGARASL